MSLIYENIVLNYETTQKKNLGRFVDSMKWGDMICAKLEGDHPHLCSND